MHTVEQTESARNFATKVGRVEIGLGVAFLILSVVLTTLQKFSLGVELEGAFALLPLLLFFGGALLVGAGAGARKYPQYVYLAQVPLVLWLAVVAFTFV